MPTHNEFYQPRLHDILGRFGQLMALLENMSKIESDLNFTTLTKWLYRVKFQCAISFDCYYTKWVFGCNIHTRGFEIFHRMAGNNERGNDTLIAFITKLNVI